MKRLLGSAVLVCGLAAGSASAQGLAYADRSRAGTVAAGGSIGFGLDPDTFLMALHLDYFPLRNLSLGPLVQMGFEDNLFILAPTLHFKGVFDIPAGGFARRVKPFVQGGVGFMYAVRDAPPGRDDDDIDFMFNFGFGCDIYLTTHFSLGNNLLFNVTPTEVFDNRLWFTWQFVNARYHF